MNVYKVTAPVIYVEARDEDEAAEIAIEHWYSFPKSDFTVTLDSTTEIPVDAHLDDMGD